MAAVLGSSRMSGRDDADDMRFSFLEDFELDGDDEDEDEVDFLEESVEFWLLLSGDGETGSDEFLRIDLEGAVELTFLSNATSSGVI
jgi:hypothetical protein